MSEATVLTERRLINILGSTTCICGKPKGARMSHCKGDYYALPPEKRKALYNRVGEGYEEAFMDSLVYLKSIDRLKEDFVYDDEA